MDTLIYTALHAWVVAWAASMVVRKSVVGFGESVGFALLLLACILARPEGILLTAGYLLVIVLARAWFPLHGKEEPQGLREAVHNMRTVLIVFGVTLGAFLVWKILTFGHILPNPYYVKANNRIFGSAGYLLPGKSITVEFLLLMYVPLLSVTTLGALILRLSRRTWGTTILLMLPSFVGVLIYSRVIHEMASGFRYEYPLLVPLAGALVLISTELYSRSRPGFLTLLIAAGVCAPLFFSPATSEILNWARHPVTAATAWWSFQNRSNPFAQVGLDLAKTGLRTEVTILLSAAGQIPYFSGGRTIDWIGLNNNYLSGRQALSLEEVWTYIAEQKPDVVYSVLPPATWGAAARETDPAFQAKTVQRSLSGQGSVLFMHLCEAVGLSILRIDHVPVHGGSLRMYAGRQERYADHAPEVLVLVAQEREAGLTELARYERFGAAVEPSRWAVRELLKTLIYEGKTVVGYGAPAKGNTF